MKQEAVGLAIVLGTGIGAQWVAWRLRLPAILLLLLAGIGLGPVTGILQPDALFGDLLLPIVSLSVGIILFEGGLSLSFADLREVGPLIRNLVTIGVVVTVLIVTLSAWLLLGLDFRIALLLGGILSVTGPTVIQPLLRHVRPVSRVNNILKWEGILIDPVGALLAVLIFEVMAAGESGARGFQFVEFGLSLVVGVAIGLAGAAFLVLLVRFHQVPDFLESAFTLASVITVFSFANSHKDELGLLSCTVMGVALANQRFVNIRRIVEFKEHLRVVILSSLFVILAARLDPDALTVSFLPAAAFLAILFFIARPATVWLSCLGREVSWQEKVFLSWMAPRGIVAAAVASVFAERLAANETPGAELLVPLTFMTIIVTVAVYGLTAAPLARKLKIAESSPDGVLIVGAHPWARQIAEVLRKEKVRVVMVDSNWQHVAAARLAGIPVHYGSVLSERVLDKIDLYGIGRLLALTPNDDANSLATIHFRDVFGQKEVYQLAPSTSNERRDANSVMHLSGRRLFGERADYNFLTERFAEGSTLKRTKITERFDYDAFREQHKNNFVPLFVISSHGNVSVCTAADSPRMSNGSVLLALVAPQADSAGEALPEEVAQP